MLGGKAISDLIDSLRQSPGLLYLTVVNLGFLTFVYVLSRLALAAYSEEQLQIHERYQHTIDIVDRCLVELQQARATNDREGRTK
jgi:hypothetical protein